MLKLRLFKLPHNVEVYGVFAHLLPAVAVQEGGDLQWARSRQGLVPDFRLRLPTPQGPSDCLVGLKCIGASSGKQSDSSDWSES